MLQHTDYFIKVIKGSTTEVRPLAVFQQGAGSKDMVTLPGGRKVRSTIPHVDYPVALLEEQININILKGFVQRISIGPDILDLETFRVEARLRRKYLDVYQTDIFQNFLDIENQAVADDDEAEALTATGSHHLVKSGAYYHVVSGNFQQAFLIGFDHGKSRLVELPDGHLALFIFPEKLPPAFVGVGIQQLETYVFYGDGAIEITLDQGFYFSCQVYHYLQTLDFAKRGFASSMWYL